MIPFITKHSLAPADPIVLGDKDVRLRMDPSTVLVAGSKDPHHNNLWLRELGQYVDESWLLDMYTIVRDCLPWRNNKADDSDDWSPDDQGADQMTFDIDEGGPEHQITAQVLTISGIAENRTSESSESLLTLFLQRDDAFIIHAFKSPAIQAVVELKWNAYGRMWLRKQMTIFYLYMFFFILFATSLAGQSDANTAGIFGKGNDEFSTSIYLLISSLFNLKLSASELAQIEGLSGHVRGGFADATSCITRGGTSLDEDEVHERDEESGETATEEDAPNPRLLRGRSVEKLLATARSPARLNTNKDGPSKCRLFWVGLWEKLYDYWGPPGGDPYVHASMPGPRLDASTLRVDPQVQTNRGGRP